MKTRRAKPQASVTPFVLFRCPPRAGGGDTSLDQIRRGRGVCYNLELRKIGVVGLLRGLPAWWSRTSKTQKCEQDHSRTGVSPKMPPVITLAAGEKPQELLSL